MDPNANSGPVNPDPKPDDIARPGPVDPATGQPNHAAETAELKGWFRENATSLVITAIVIALVCVYLDPIDTLKVVFGLGLVIFIHELGHFLAAKWCDVHVRTFSIGFGPAVPFCSYKWGETTYMVGIIPLGGYVAMVGEGEGEDNEDGDEDPRSFRKKSVGQRMLIISAGVIMNIILGLACFMAVYMHGVPEKPATLGYVESGGAAWRAGMRTGDQITQIGTREKPFFNDLRPIVMSSGKNEEVKIKWTRGGTETEGTVTPIRDEGQRFPQLGISPPSKLELMSGVKRKVPPYFPGSPAAAAEGAGGKKFEPGDRIVKMTDPANPNGPLTPVADYNDYHKRMVLLAKTDVAFEVKRKGSDDAATITVKPAFRHDLGMRMRMGEVVALRKGGPAEGKVVARAEGPKTRGDRIKAVMLPPENGKSVWYVAGPVDFTKPEFKTENPKAVEVRPLDPLLLPHQLHEWAANKTAPTAVELVVGRAAHPTDATERVTVAYDPSFRFDREAALQPNSPLPLSGLGLAYWVEAVVDDVTAGGPAAGATTAPGELSTGWYYKARRGLGIDGRDVAPGGEHRPLQAGDLIVAVRLKALGEDGTMKAGAWKDDLKPHQWASADTVFQSNAAEIDLRVKRGDEVFTVTLKGRPNTDWGTDDRGLVFQAESQIQKATDVGDALALGGRRTLRFIKEVYMNLYAMIAGRVSAKTMSGPLTIANVSYRLAGEDFWQFLLFIGMISVNLAVVNFLPIPVLDGGHMVFLIYEKVTGRPLPDRVFAIFMYAGLCFILLLMFFVLFLDVGRLFFGVT